MDKSEKIARTPGVDPLSPANAWGGVSALDGVDGGLDIGAGGGADCDLGGKAEGVGTVAHARVPEAPPFGRGVEQLEARLPHKQEVEGSSPSSATTDSFRGSTQGAADAGPDTARTADPSLDLPPWPWPCSPRAAPAPRGLFPHQRFA